MARNDYERLYAADVKALLALMGELHDLAEEPAACRQHLIRTLRRLTEAHLAVWALLQEPQRGSKRAPWRIEAIADTGWPRAAEADAARHCLDSGRDPMQIIARRKGAVVTAARQELIGDRQWYALPQVSEVRRGCGTDDCIYSLHRLEDGEGILLAVHRAWGDRRRFGARERLLLHLLNGELGSIYRMGARLAGGAPDTRPADARQLTPRMRQTLDLLLSGASEKQAAEKLGVSPNTLHVYVRGLYKHFRVNTRAELLARFVSKNH